MKEASISPERPVCHLRILAFLADPPQGIPLTIGIGSKRTLPAVITGAIPAGGGVGFWRKD